MGVVEAKADAVFDHAQPLPSPIGGRIEDSEQCDLAAHALGGRVRNGG